MFLRKLEEFGGALFLFGILVFINGFMPALMFILFVLGTILTNDYLSRGAEIQELKKEKEKLEAKLQKKAKKKIKSAEKKSGIDNTKAPESKAEQDKNQDPRMDTENYSA